jgi:uncharacterized membrane protein
MSHHTVLRAAMASLFAMGAVSTATSALAADDREQCAGVVKAGKNDCATSTNACHGHVATDGNAEAWIYVPKGTCDRIAGARIVHVKEPAPQAK